MDLRTVVDVLNARVDELGRGCYWETASFLVRYRETQKLIQACGHDTSELEQAIDAAGKAVAEMEIVRDKVVSRFKANGVCFIVDESKRKEIEQAKLQ